MKPMVTLIRNIAIQGHASQAILDEIEDISEILEEVLTSHRMGRV